VRLAGYHHAERMATAVMLLPTASVIVQPERDLSGRPRRDPASPNWLALVVFAFSHT